MNAEAGKRAAAAAAVELVEPGMRLGIGTGSTAEIFVRLLAERVAGGLEVVGVPTSERTAAQCRELGVPLTTLAETPDLDLAIDGTDEFDPALNLIKGGGGAHLREKIVAASAARFVVIADPSKRVAVLGAFALPVEIIAMAERPLARRIAALGCAVTRRQRNGATVLTDEGNPILDCEFGPAIADPAGLAARLSAMPGVVEHGLFCGMAERVIVGAPEGAETVFPAA